MLPNLPRLAAEIGASFLVLTLGWDAVKLAARVHNTNGPFIGRSALVAVAVIGSLAMVWL